MKILKECIYDDNIAGNYIYCKKIKNGEIKKSEK